MAYSLWPYNCVHSIYRTPIATIVTVRSEFKSISVLYVEKQTNFQWYLNGDTSFSERVRDDSSILVGEYSYLLDSFPAVTILNDFSNADVGSMC